jgi:hypothetical protein
MNWLETRAGNPFPARAGEACPPAEDLYDYGRGPGAVAPPPQRQRELQAHLVACAECRALIATLSVRPGPPIVGGELPPEPRAAVGDEAGAAVADDGEPTPDAIAAPEPPAPLPIHKISDERRRLRRVWIPLAAAAVVLVALGVWWRETRAAGDRPSELVARGTVFPAAPLLRGESGDALWFPRDRVLARGEANAPWSAVLFELAPRAGATEYRVLLRRNDGGAFERGTEVATLRGSGTELALEPADLARLTPGRYTWEAWAQAGGLDTFLGRRDFELVADRELDRALAALERESEPERSSRILALLHERGFVGDARAFARTLPESAERDQYLEQVPGR